MKEDYRKSIFYEDFFNVLFSLITVNVFLYSNMDELFEDHENYLKELYMACQTLNEINKSKDEVDLDKFMRDIREKFKSRLPPVSIADIRFQDFESYKNSFDLVYSLNQQLSREVIEYQLLKNRLLAIFSAFEQYLYSSFKFILLKYPNILSEKTINFGRLLNLNIEDNFQLIIEEVIEKELHDLFYRDFDEIFDYAEKKLSLTHNISKTLISELNETKLVRNLFVHSNGVVNHIFLSKTSNKNLKLGEHIGLSEKLLDELSSPIEICVEKFDRLLIKKLPELEFKD